LLLSKEVLAVARQYSRRKLKGRGGGFGSWYCPGCFLSTHDDAGYGGLAFVYQLTKGWRPEFGGCLNLVSDDHAGVESLVVPGFNKLVLFDISGPRGRPHFVSEVASGVIPKRFSISGWYS
jgi:Rps23 Pro-64 3,4-dihydroxylase Tpa1-like proline 4-hydroxylase